MCEINKCRGCRSSPQFLYPLFETESLLKLFEKFVQIEVLQKDEFPNGVCAICVDKLNSFDIFQKQCIANDNYFKSIVKINATTSIFTTPPKDLNVNPGTDVLTKPFNENTKVNNVDLEMKLNNAKSKTSVNKPSDKAAKYDKKLDNDDTRIADDDGDENVGNADHGEEFSKNNSKITKKGRTEKSLAKEYDP